MATVGTDDLFDLAGNIGQRFEDFVFELLDDAHNVIGQLDVNESNAPTIAFDTSRSTMRTCTGLSITASSLAGVNSRRDRVRPSIVLQNGRSVELGVFMFGTDARAPSLGRVRWTPDLFDESFLLAQQLDAARGVAPGGSILGLLISLATEVGITDFDIEVADQPASGAMTFPATTLRQDAVSALAAALGGFPPYMANSGALTLKAIPGDGAGPEHVYELGTHLLEGSVVVTDSSYKAPNEYIVTNGDPAAPVIGVYRLPASSPNSQAQTGYVVSNTTTINGITAAVANDVAKALAITDASSYTQATFDSTADARHGGFDIVQLLGSLYVETGWSLSCVPGGKMTHTCTAIYA